MFLAAAELFNSYTLNMEQIFCQNEYEIVIDETNALDEYDMAELVLKLFRFQTTFFLCIYFNFFSISLILIFCTPAQSVRLHRPL